MDDPTIPGLTGSLDYQPEHREEGIAFTLYPADTSEPLAYILRGAGAEQVAKRLAQRWNAHDEILAALKHMTELASAEGWDVSDARAVLAKVIGEAS